MKNEVYSCLKMLESLHNKGINIQRINEWNSAEALGDRYREIWELLKKYLTPEQLEFVPYVPVKDFILESQRTHTSYIVDICTSCDIAIAYLKSLDMDLNKELSIKKEELKLRENEIEHMQKLLSKSLDAIKQFPELQRSKVVEEIKKSHREIEENTNQNTKSQNNKNERD